MGDVAQGDAGVGVLCGEVEEGEEGEEGDVVAEGAVLGVAVVLGYV